MVKKTCMYLYLIFFISGLKGRTPSITDLGEIEYGDRVIVAGQRKGTVKYVGESKFAPGKKKCIKYTMYMYIICLNFYFLNEAF